jgi:molybdate transport system ATP-binding protein
MTDIRLIKTLTGAAGNFDLDVQMHIADGSLVALYGPSGAGKTSILRMIAGVFKPSDGRVEVNGNLWYDHTSRIYLKPQMRRVGIVFQDYALFPNMTVRGNISYGLQKGEAPGIVDELITMMELGGLHNKLPHVLSGGQRQRVALARAIVRRPDLLLLDEPLAALDSELRSRMQEYILTVHRQYKLTTILVSHDILEVMKLADTVFVLADGKICRQGSPAQVMPVDYLRDTIATLEESLRKEQ